MKTLTIILTVLITSLSYGQCKYKVNEKDKFSGKKELLTKHNIVYSNTSGFMMLYFGSTDGNPYLILDANTVGKPFFIKGKEKSLIFIFQDGSKLELARNQNSKVTSTVPGGGRWNIKTTYSLSSTQLKMLQSKKIASVRMRTSEGDYDHDKVKDKWAGKVMESAKCI